MFAFALFFRAVAIALEASRLLWLEPIALFRHARLVRRNGARRFYFDVRIGGSVIPDDIGVFSLSEDDAMADAVQALDEIGHLSTLQGEDIGADEIIVSDDEGREVGRIASVSGVGGPPLDGSSASWPVASEEGLPPNCELPGQAHLTVGNKMSLVDHPPHLSHFRLGAVSFRRARRVPETR